MWHGDWTEYVLHAWAASQGDAAQLDAEKVKDFCDVLFQDLYESEA